MYPDGCFLFVAEFTFCRLSRQYLQDGHFTEETLSEAARSTERIKKEKSVAVESKLRALIKKYGK